MCKPFDVDISGAPIPCYLIDESRLINNLEIIKSVIDRTGCKILLAQKAFSMFSTYPLISEYISGSAASGLYEARLGSEEMGGETHIYSPAYAAEEFNEIISVCDHIIFNNFRQFDRFYTIIKKSGANIEAGIRINPEYSEFERDIYNPCAKYSRLGCVRADFPEALPEGISGLHFHTMCEQDSDVLERTVKAVEEKFGDFLGNVKWLNLGGGHHITRPGYDIERLISIILYLREKYGVDVYLEPGEAVALNAGFLVSEVLDVMNNGMDIAILDVSAACHMPDVIEAPYRPDIIGAGEAGEKPYLYRLGGNTCLAGDIIGDYSFDSPLLPGDRLIFRDMAIYTMVKNNTFNGMRLPSIVLRTKSGEKKIIRSFGYEDFKNRL